MKGSSDGILHALHFGNVLKFVLFFFFFLLERIHSEHRVCENSVL